jgi:hypothetical protein
MPTAPAVQAWIPALAGKCAGQRIAAPIIRKPSGTKAYAKWSAKTKRSPNVRSPAQRRRRIACSSPTARNNAPATWDRGNPTHAPKDSALTPIVSASYREKLAGIRPGLFRANQVWVKLGTMRPPTGTINPIGSGANQRHMFRSVQRLITGNDEFHRDQDDNGDFQA